MEYMLNCNGKLLSLDTPQVMGILNATPDSFYAGSRTQTEREVAERVTQILAEEMERLRMALSVVRREAPDAIVSVDTFRPDVARMAVEEYGADIINDVGGCSQYPMFRMVSRLGVPYIYMSRQPDIRQVLLDCASVVDTLRSLGQKDIVIDPGFGFGKTVDENYAVMQQLEDLWMLHLPVLVGVSRKSMIYKLLQTDASAALNGTTALNAIALMKGASILRVHDVKAAVETVRIVGKLNIKS